MLPIMRIRFIGNSLIKRLTAGISIAPDQLRDLIAKVLKHATYQPSVRLAKRQILESDQRHLNLPMEVLLFVGMLMMLKS